MTALAAIHSLAPRLHAILSGRLGENAAAPVRRSLAETLALAEAGRVVRELRARGVRRVAAAADPELLAALFRSGLLADLEVRAAYVPNPGRPFLCASGRVVPQLPLDQADFAPDQAVLTSLPGTGATLVPVDKLAALPALPPDTFPMEVPNRFAAAYADFTASYFQQVREVLRSEEDIRRTVLFAGVFTYFNFSKLSLALRERGYRTAFLCLNPSNLAHKEHSFDVALDAFADPNLFFGVLAEFPFRLVHFQGWVNLHCFAAAAALCAQAPTVVEFNDLPQMLFTPREYDRVFGPGRFADDVYCARLAAATSQGQVFNYHQACAERFAAEMPGPGPRLHFLSQPLPAFFASERPAPASPPWKVVFTGTLNPSSYPRPPFGDVQLLDLARLLASQGIEFHVHPTPYQDSSRTGPFWDYHYLMQGEERFLLHPGLPPQAMTEAVADMHYGSMLYIFAEDSTVLPEHLAAIMPTKFFAYLEAGLPVLVSSAFTCIGNLVREHGLGLVVEPGELPRLAEILDHTDHAALRASVRRYRAAHSLPAELDALLGLHDAAAARPLADVAPGLPFAQNAPPCAGSHQGN